MNNSESVNHNDITSNKEQQDDNKPFFVMTLEFEKGKQEYIKIFPHTDPDEVSFNFCKENNLDFVSMKYLKDEINELLSKFNEKKMRGGIIGSNNSIKKYHKEKINIVEEYDNTLSGSVKDGNRKVVFSQPHSKSEERIKIIENESYYDIDNDKVNCKDSQECNDVINEDDGDEDEGEIKIVGCDVVYKKQIVNNFNSNSNKY
jgi:hypothetical protein